MNGAGYPLTCQGVRLGFFVLQNKMDEKTDTLSEVLETDIFNGRRALVSSSLSTLTMRMGQGVPMSGSGVSKLITNTQASSPQLVIAMAMAKSMRKMNTFTTMPH
jgi:hypothetical protein